MRLNAKFAAAGILVAALPVPAGAALAADLVIVTNRGAVPSLNEIAAAFSRATGNHVSVVLSDGNELERRLNNHTVDLVSENPGPLQELVKTGKIVAGSVTPFQLADLGLTVRSGAPKPDIGTPEKYRAALLAAKSISYSRGCSGTNIAAGIAQLGLTDALKSKTTFTTKGPVSDYVARGDVEIGIQQSNIMVGVPGNDFVGSLPAAVNKPCESDLGLVATSKEPDAARALIRFAVSPEAAPLIRKTHAEPAKR